FILITLYLKKEGVMIVSSILVPVLIFITVVVVCSYLYNYKVLWTGKLVLTDKFEWYKDSILYGAYNMVIAIAVIGSIVSREEVQDIVAGGMLGGIILFILNILIYSGLVSAFRWTPGHEIPLLFLAASCGKKMYIAYIIALYFGMVTTAIANFFAFVKRFTVLFTLKYETGVIISIFLILPLIPAGFSTLVNYLYPFFGYLAVIIIIFYIYLLWKKS
ncbi:MAG: hypothetical protein ACOCQN_02400, partial [Halanaerobiaceae bacterium]